MVYKYLSQSTKQITSSIYFQTDKEVYDKGEDIWFKSIVFDNRSFLSIEDSLLYIQLVRIDTGEKLYQRIFPLQSGVGSGNIFINQDFPVGRYRLEGYTSSALKISNGELIRSVNSKELIVGNNINPRFQFDSKIENIDGKEDLQFLFSNLKFDGKPLAKGSLRIVVFENDLIVETLHADLEATKGDHFFSKEFAPIITHFSLTFNNDEHMENFIITNPYNLHHNLEDTNFIDRDFEINYLDLQNDSINFQVKRKGESPPSIYYLRLHGNGIVYYVSKFTFDNETTIKFPSHDLPGGIMEVALFDENFKCVTGQLLFAKKRNQINISLKSDRPIYNPKSKVRLQLKVLDENGDPLQAELGISVSDVIYKAKGFQERNIENHNLFYKQFVDYKLANDELSVQNKFSSRILEQKYKESYKWSEHNLHNNVEASAVLNNYLVGRVSARESRTKKEKEVFQPVVAVFSGIDESKNKIKYLLDGEFELGYDELVIGQGDFTYIKAFPIPGNRVKVSIDSPFEDLEEFNSSFINPIAPLSTWGKEENDEFPQHIYDRPVIQLSEVYVEAKRLDVKKSGYVARLDSLKKLQGNHDYVCKYGAGVLNCPVCGPTDIKPIEGKQYIVYNENFVNRAQGNGVHILFNGNDFKRVTYKYPEYSEEELLELNNLGRVLGFPKVQTFDLPKYDDDALHGIPDYRNTLYWNPKLLTNENGELELEFYTSEIESLFVIHVEGIAQKGMIVSEAITFEVKKGSSNSQDPQ
ncbi:MAG: hypothetical protein ACK4SB_03205 [Belliella pelovolcani]